MNVTVQGKKGRRSVTATGESRAQAQGRAGAAWRKKYGEFPTGVRFEVIEQPADKPAKRKSKTSKRSDAGEAKPKPEKRSGPVVPIDGIESGHYLVIGVTAGGRVDEVLAAASIAGAKALAQNGAALKGSHRILMRVDYVVKPDGRTIPGDARIKPGELEHLTRVVLGLDGGKRLVNAEHFAGTPPQARAVGDAMPATYSVIGAVTYVFQP